MLWPGAIGAPQSTRGVNAGGGIPTTAITIGSTAYATPTQIVNSTAYDVGYIGIRCNVAIGVSITRKDLLVKVMIGGVGVETDLIGPVPMGGYAAGACLLLPVFVPAGTRISITGKGTGFTTLAFSIDLYGAHPSGVYPSRWRSDYATGLDSGSTWHHGTLLTAGNTNTWSAWTLIGANLNTADDWWVACVGSGTAGSGWGALAHRYQIAIGPTGGPATMATNGTVPSELVVGTTATELAYSLEQAQASTMGGYVHTAPFYAKADGPTLGEFIYVRAMCSGTYVTNSLSICLMRAIF